MHVGPIPCRIVTIGLKLFYVLSEFQIAHLIRILLRNHKISRFFRQIDHGRGKLFKDREVSSTEMCDQDIVKKPMAVYPLGALGINTHGQLKFLIQIIDRDSLEQVLIRMENLEIIDTLPATVPDLILLETSQRLLFLNFHFENIVRLLVGVGDDEFAK